MASASFHVTAVAGELMQSLIEAIECSVPVETSKEMLATSPDELKRLVVFAPRLTPFMNRSPNSMRHPRVTQIVWAQEITSKTSTALVTQVKDPLEAMVRWQHTDMIGNSAVVRAQIHRWNVVGEVFDPLITTIDAAAYLRDHISKHVDWQRALRRFWDKLVVPVEVLVKPQDSLDKISQSAYFYFEIRVIAALWDDRAVMDCIDSIEQDFYMDCKDAPGVTYTNFANSMLELADNWTSSVNVDEYVAFLVDLYDKTFTADWAVEADAILFTNNKKKIPNAIAVHQFRQWEETQKKKQDYMKKYISSIEAEELEKAELAKEGEDDDASPDTATGDVRSDGLRRPGSEAMEGSTSLPLSAAGGVSAKNRVAESAPKVPRTLAELAQQKLSLNMKLSKREQIALVQDRRERQQKQQRTTFRAVPPKLVALTSKHTLSEAVAEVKSSVEFATHNNHRASSAKTKSTSSQ